MADEVRMIDAKLLKGYLIEGDGDDEFTEGYNCAINEIRELIDKRPTIEAEPVKHGRWIKHRIDDPKSILYGAVKDTTCSICGKSTPYNTEYCMHCGARMDLKDGDSDD